MGGCGYGISAVATNKVKGLVAYAEKGVSPTVNVFGFPDLKKPLVTLEGAAQLDVDALAISRHGEYLVRDLLRSPSPHPPTHPVSPRHQGTRCCARCASRASAAPEKHPTGPRREAFPSA